MVFWVRMLDLGGWVLGCGDNGAGALQSLQPALRVRKEEFRTVLATYVAAGVERFFVGPEGLAVLSRHRELIIHC